MIRQYTEEQEGEPVIDDSRFQLDPSLTPRHADEGGLVFQSVKDQFDAKHLR